MRSSRDKFRVLAGQFYEQHGKQDVAAEAMTAALLADEPEMRSLLHALVYEACKAMIGEEHRGRRKETYHGLSRKEPLVTTAAAGRGGVEALAAATQTALMNFPLEDGTVLGDATRDKLTTLITLYRSVAKSNTVKARWLELVQQSVPPGKIVRAVLTNERLNELRSEARLECV